MTTAYRARSGWAALVAALVGFVGFGFLVAALAAPTPSPTTLRRYEALFRWQDAFVLLQAMLMIYVTPAAASLGRPAGSAADRIRQLGVIAQGLLAISVLVRFANVTSDMTYMLPQAIVGLWLLAVNRTSGREGLPRGVVWLGRVAGGGLLIVGVGFLIYAALVAPRVLLGPLSTAEIDAQTWTTPNIVAHVLLAAGTVLGRATYPLWALLLGLRLLTTDHGLQLDKAESLNPG